MKIGFKTFLISLLFPVLTFSQTDTVTMADLISEKINNSQFYIMYYVKFDGTAHVLMSGNVTKDMICASAYHMASETCPPPMPVKPKAKDEELLKIKTNGSN